ncbi:tRNA-dihydrouridine(20a/20b) synthase [Paramyrothecium foliicola]|nr:tRNA-dihydrouridine(20a/20b) synthase [Paramyrothecium foliicola]
MAAAVTSREASLMPGTFSPEDYIDLHYNPFSIIEIEKRGQEALRVDSAASTSPLYGNPVGLASHDGFLLTSPREPTEESLFSFQSKATVDVYMNGEASVSAPPETPKGTDSTPKDSAGASLYQPSIPEVNIGDVDWTEFKPPALLGKAPTVTSQILLDIVASSIDNVKARAAEEYRLKSEEEVARAREQKAAMEARRAEELFLPIIVREETESSPRPPKDFAEIISRNSLGSSSDDHTPDVSALAGDSNKPRRRKVGLKRLFHRTGDGGESSVVVGTRETLRQKLRTKLNSLEIDSSELLAQQALSIFSGAGITLTNEPDTLVECVSCLDEFPSKAMVRVPCHHYCTDCFIRLITAAVENEQQWPAKCCLNPIPFRTVLRIVPNDLRNRFQERSREWNIPIAERVYCHAADCGIWIMPDYISPGIRQGRCENGHWTCTICRGPIHGNEDCPDDPDMILTNSLAEEEGWKRCDRCHALVEHKEACQHMTCRCGNQFCYVCGATWRTCACTVQQLQQLKSGVSERRRQREFQEQEEAEELRRILAQIEEFEREEAMRAEQERLERERQEEERRQRELEERALQESIRRREVEEKFIQLRQSLAALHELQHVMVDSYQQTSSEDLTKEATAAKERLTTEQILETSRTTSLIRTKLSAREAEFDEEFALRISEEEMIESEYQNQLSQYWAGHEGGAEAIDAAMLSLRQRMDEGYHSWQRWKGEELDSYREKLDNQRIIQEELMYSVRQRLDDQYAEKRLHLSKQSVAEGKWLQEIILERERLLSELELQELEGDADSLFAPEDADRGDESSMPGSPLKIFDAAKKQDKFIYACAPMVRYGKLAFRQTVHKYGVDICWTPMILAKEFNRNSFARDSDFTISTQGPQVSTILQFGANSPLELARASSLAAPYVNGVDLNCGCPQSWACAETLGAALMNERELVRDMVVETRKGLAQDGWDVGMDKDKDSAKGRSVSVKIRIHDDLRKTMDFLDTVIGHPQNRQVDWVTIHPRTRRTPSTVPIRTDALEILTSKYSPILPVLLSGDVFEINSLPFSNSKTSTADHFKTLTIRDKPRGEVYQIDGLSQENPKPSNTGISGFMSARGLLANPAMFAGHASCPWEALETFMCNVARCPLPLKVAIHHVQEMCGPGMGKDKAALLSKKERARLTELTNMSELVDFLDDKIAEHAGRTSGLRRDL